MLNTVLIHHRFQYWSDRIGGTRSGRQDAVFGGNIAIVNTVNNVLNVALARCSQDYLRSTVAFQMLTKASLVAPNTGVIDDDGIIDTVIGVINFGR